jgi:hypothetical protein
MALKDKIDVFLNGAKTNFEKYGNLLPIFACILDERTKVFGLVWKNAEDKELFSQQIKQWISENKISEYIMVTEAWSLSDFENAQEWIQEYGTLEMHPSRKEMIVVQYCSAQEEIDCTAEIFRGSIITVGEWQVIQRDVRFRPEDFSARFQGLFLKGKASQN